MAAVTSCGDFGAQENKVCHCFHCLPIYFSWGDGGLDAMMLVFWTLSFKPTFLLSSFTFIKRLFSSSSLTCQKKNLLLLYWLCQSLWLCGSQQTEKFWKRWEYQTTWPASWEICMQVKKQQLELDMEQQTDSKSGKEYIKAAYCHPAYLTYMQSTSCEMPGWIKYKVESRFPGEILLISDMQKTPPLWILF